MIELRDLLMGKEPRKAPPAPPTPAPGITNANKFGEFG